MMTKASRHPHEQPIAQPTSGPVPTSPRNEAGTSIAVGETIASKYFVEAVIGEGGVGFVYAAQNLELDERVALKVLKDEMLAREEIVGRFMREAKAVCRIKSENVAAVYDVGTTRNGAPFFVMEYLDGQDLRVAIDDQGRLGVREVTDYAMQVCAALAVAHAEGIVHRDIKPENLFLTKRAGLDVVKVLDFGISKTALTGSVLSSVLPLVKTTNLMGTPLYMSPEQIRSAERVDSRSDIWSLGMVMFEALAGRLPVQADSITELCAAILESPFDSLSNYRNDLPDGLMEVIEKCLEKRVEDRYQNVAELAMALLPFAPTRSRICAERAANALAGAGLIERDAVRFPSSAPPSLNSDQPRMSVKVGVGSSRASRLTTTQDGERIRGSKSPEVWATIHSASANQVARARKLKVAGVLVCIVVSAVAVIALLSPSERQAAKAPEKAAASAAPVVATPEPAPVETAAQAPNSPSTATGSASSPKATTAAKPQAPAQPQAARPTAVPAKATAAAPARPVATTAPAPATPSVAPPAKKSEGPDIGY
ncbi:serine/threonine protein kinase [Labilithrix luteola]|uniref:Serine/threonine protein kinase n=1 Tax=Labilithrix luteola TaxID=1391654 RepID=A0A0K1Q5J0_9BACT|nr:serine/threonine-protein kinase [Labilithrix luteola]AKV00989.1 serine/threonine protein kinase [Labilithrix luteola]